MKLTRRISVFSIVAIVVALFAASCSKSSAPAAGGGGSTSAGGTLTVDGQTLNNHGTSDVSNETSVVVDMNNFYFSPTVITGGSGQSVKIELKNSSGTTHNFSVNEPGLSVSQDIVSGGDQFVTVKIPTSGSVVFFCKFHQTSGMRGALEVTGAPAPAAGSPVPAGAGTSGGSGSSGSSGSGNSGSGGYHYGGY